MGLKQRVSVKSIRRATLSCRCVRNLLQLKSKLDRTRKRNKLRKHVSCIRHALSTFVDLIRLNFIGNRWNRSGKIERQKKISYHSKTMSDTSHTIEQEEKKEWKKGKKKKGRKKGKILDWNSAGNLQIVLLSEMIAIDNFAVWSAIWEPKCGFDESSQDQTVGGRRGEDFLYLFLDRLWTGICVNCSSTRKKFLMKSKLKKCPCHLNLNILKKLD